MNRRHFFGTFKNILMGAAILPLLPVSISEKSVPEIFNKNKPLFATDLKAWEEIKQCVGDKIVNHGRYNTVEELYNDTFSVMDSFKKSGKIKDFRLINFSIDTTHPYNIGWGGRN